LDGQNQLKNGPVRVGPFAAYSGTLSESAILVEHVASAQTMETAPNTPRLVASTADTYCCSIAESRIRESKLQDVQAEGNQQANVTEGKEADTEVNFFKSAEL